MSNNLYSTDTLLPDVEMVSLQGGDGHEISFYNALFRKIIDEACLEHIFENGEFLAIQKGIYGIIYRFKNNTNDLVFHLSLRPEEETRYNEYIVSRENADRLKQAWQTIENDIKLKKLCEKYDYFPAEVVLDSDIYFENGTYYYYATKYLEEFAELGVLTHNTGSAKVRPNILFLLPPLDNKRNKMFEALIDGYSIPKSVLMNYLYNIIFNPTYPWNTNRNKKESIYNFARFQEIQLIRYYYLLWRVFNESLPSQFSINAGDLMVKCPTNNEPNSGILNGARLIALQGEKVKYSIGELKEFLNIAKICSHSVAYKKEGKLFSILSQHDINAIIDDMEREYNDS